MGSRIGSAFILIGVIVLIVYLLGFGIGQSDRGLLLAGLLLSLTGLVLRRRSAARSKRRPARFQTLRRMLGDKPEEQE